MSPSLARCHVAQSSTPSGAPCPVLSSTFYDNRSANVYSSQVDIRARIWVCPFCLQRNPLPPHYKDITENTIPPELHQLSTTIEYQLARPAPVPPIFLFVVDTCQEDDSLDAVRKSLIMSLSHLPPDALVGLITYGTMVSHDTTYLWAIGIGTI